MSKAVLHIGMHKSGTTAVQQTYALNRRVLRAHGLFYPDIAPAHGHHGLVTKWLPKLQEIYHPANGADALWEETLKQHHAADKVLFLSSEEFSRGRPSARVDFKELRNMLDGFDDVQVICTLRNQVPFLQSIYSEISKKKAPHPWPLFLSQALKSGYAAGLFLDFNQLHDHLLEGFAPEEITYLDYSRFTADSTAQQKHILSLCGIDLPADALQFKNGGRSNVSASALSVWAANQINTDSAAPSALVTLCDRVLREHVSDQPSSFFSRAEERKVMAHFSEPNRTFQARIQAVQPDFALTPYQPSDKTIYREDLRTRFWLALAKAIYNA